ncbi:hypothetical protein KKA08_09095, partial [bacterium]|nr:hypothetical protein [bacterium]
SAGVNSGMYYTAKTHSTLGFDIGIRTMMVFIPDGESAILDSADVSLFPVPVIQASVGLLMDIDLTVRGFAIKFDDETISLYGAGLKKNLKPFIPVPQFPSLSAALSYHQFKAGDILKSSHFSMSVLASKSFIFVTPYIGVAYDINSMTFEYDYEAEGLDPIPIEQTIKANSARLTLGLTISPFPFVKIFGDYNIGTFNEVTAGLAVSIR